MSDIPSRIYSKTQTLHSNHTVPCLGYFYCKWGTGLHSNCLRGFSGHASRTARSTKSEMQARLAACYATPNSFPKSSQRGEHLSNKQQERFTTPPCTANLTQPDNRTASGPCGLCAIRILEVAVTPGMIISRFNRGSQYNGQSAFTAAVMPLTCLCYYLVTNELIMLRFPSLI